VKTYNINSKKNLRVKCHLYLNKGKGVTGPVWPRRWVEV